MTVTRKSARFASVWDALEDTPSPAANMRLRSELMIAVRWRAKGWKVTQAEAAHRLGITQPRLNDLVRGHIEKFNLDALIDLATRADLEVRLDVHAAA